MGKIVSPYLIKDYHLSNGRQPSLFSPTKQKYDATTVREG
jgi:hypothetical protein